MPRTDNVFSAHVAPQSTIARAGGRVFQYRFPNGWGADVTDLNGNPDEWTINLMSERPDGTWAHACDHRGNAEAVCKTDEEISWGILSVSKREPLAWKAIDAKPKAAAPEIKATLPVSGKTK